MDEATGPRHAQPQDPQGPLSGLRVVELASKGPGPFCAMMLADMGAEVLRIERLGAPREHAETYVMERSRHVIALDLKTRSGVESARTIAHRADVLIEGFRPGVAERIGIGPDVLLDEAPGLVYGRVTGWGQKGPLAHTAGHDINYIARTGLLHAIGREDGPPQIPLNTVGDFGGGGMFLTVGILAALWERQRTGRGQVIDAAIVDGVTTLLATQLGSLAGNRWQDRRGVNRLDGGSPFYSVYETADSRWVAVGAIEPRFAFELLETLQITAPQDIEDSSSWPTVRAEMAERFSRHTREHWETVFHGTDACVSPVLSFNEAMVDDHNRERKTHIDIAGVGQPAPAPRFSRTQPAAPRSSDDPGDAETLLKSWQVPKSIRRATSARA